MLVDEMNDGIPIRDAVGSQAGPHNLEFATLAAKS
jgi:hypothetical protein